MIRLLASLFAQELSRHRHRPDPLADMTVPATLGTPVWPPVVRSLADDARDELLATLMFEKRRGTLPPSVYGALTTWLEAKA